MKNTILKRMAGITLFLMLAVQFSSALAANDVSSTSNSSGTATTSSGATDSSSEAKDTTETKDTTAPATSSAGTATTAPKTSSVVEAVDVTTDANATKVVEDVANTTSDTTTSTTAEGVFQDLKNYDDTKTADSIHKVEKAVEDKILKLKAELKKNPKQHDKLMDNMKRLRNLITEIRVKTLQNNKKVADKLRRVVRLHTVYEVRWGVLNGKRKVCTAVKADDLKKSLDQKELPTKCHLNVKKVDYKGKITVDSGVLNVRKKILFEKNDKVVVSNGKSIAFDSVIAGHWDGMIVEYKPPLSTDKTAEIAKKSEIQITISLGDLNKTFKGAEVFGRKKIGNGHFIEIKPILRALPHLSAADQDKMVKAKLKIQEKLKDFREKIDRLRLLNKGGAGADSLEKLVDEATSYNFDDTSSSEVETEIVSVINALKDSVSADDLTKKAKEFKSKMESFKKNAKVRKFANKLIPFKDTDDHEWFTKYVSSVKNRGIVSGYKDAKGKELGEFRPGNNVTVGEILKMGLETAGKGKAKGKTPKLKNAAKHWAKDYAAKAEELKLDLVKKDIDLNRPATRGEVIRMILEATGVKPTKVSKTEFKDVATNHKHADFIQYANDLGIVSGDDGKGTFRPDAPINRAEVSKISDLVNEVIIGGTDSIIIGGTDTATGMIGDTGTVK